MDSILPADAAVWGAYCNTAMCLSGQPQGYEVLHGWGAVDGVAYGLRESIVVDVHPAFRVLSLKVGPGQHGEPLEDAPTRTAGKQSQIATKWISGCERWPADHPPG
jgi:hypothetical protein